MVKILVCRVGQANSQFNTSGGECVGDVFDENEAEHQVLVLGGIHVGS